MTTTVLDKDPNQLGTQVTKRAGEPRSGKSSETSATFHRALGNRGTGQTDALEELIAWSTDPQGIDRQALEDVDRRGWGIEG